MCKVSQMLKTGILSPHSYVSSIFICWDCITKRKNVILEVGMPQQYHVKSWFALRQWQRLEIYNWSWLQRRRFSTKQFHFVRMMRHTPYPWQTFIARFQCAHYTWRTLLHCLIRKLTPWRFQHALSIAFRMIAMPPTVLQSLYHYTSFFS